MTLSPGTRLGPYEITALLGSGGMAEVYRARDSRLGREVAVKILPSNFATDSDSLARFELEAKTASGLNHPHLVTIYDIGEAEVDGRPRHYMAMELIRGGSLRERMNELSRAQFLRYIADVADGLAKAHDAGVVHRDLKPENIMISDDGFAKVVDFGLAKHLPEVTEHEQTAKRLTVDGYAVGTLDYMAPEQLQSTRDIDARTDIFALGCILYEKIAGQNPFNSKSPIDTMHRIVYHEPPLLPDAAIERIARRCLSKDRDQRYATMREVAADVRAAISTPVRRPVRRKRVIAAVAAVLALSIGASGAYVAFHHRRAPAITSIAVLPFENASGNEELRFLTDGIAEDVVRNLGRVPTLRVIANSSASRFRDIDDPQRAARALSVDAVLVGRLRKSGATLQLDAELVRAEDATALWGKKYVRKLTDLVSLEEEIARDLCDEVRLKLAPQNRRAPNPEAHQAYLRGQLEVAKDTAASLKKALEYFHQAVEADPEYALAHAGIAEVYGRQVVLGLVPTQDGILQQIAAAEKALALDESLPEGHWNLAFAASITENAAEYERRSARVLQLSPNFAPAYVERAIRLLLAKRFDEAEAAFQKSRVLDPLSVRGRTAYGIYLVIMRRFDRANVVLRDLTEQFPDNTNAYAYLAMTYSFTDRHADALAIIDRAVAANPSYSLWRAQVLARAGRVAEARPLVAAFDASGEDALHPDLLSRLGTRCGGRQRRRVATA